MPGFQSLTDTIIALVNYMDPQINVVYKIPFSDCPWNYVGETGRCFQTRKKEHKRNLKNYAKGSNIANHAWSNNHLIDFENARVMA